MNVLSIPLYEDKDILLFYSLMHLPVRRTMPNTEQVLMILNKLVNYFLRIVDAYSWKEKA